ncbi:MAG TPA: cytochrome c peroxidase [Myxococcota bacterium]|jgi:cytochrome c peroxidase|nr:cytochrome c peroxidase [Myxococcota bacterium]
MKSFGRALLIALGTGMLAVGCGSDPLTRSERGILEGFRLGPVPPDPTNAVADDPAAAALGQQLFFDTRFSGPLLMDSALGLAGEAGLVACATCHEPAEGGTDHRSTPGNVSIAAGYTGRNAPTIYNARHDGPWEFWDGRRDSLWSQALGPLESAAEHDGSRLQYAHLLYDCYRPAYEATFGPMPDLADAVRFPPDGKPGDPPWEAMAAADQDAVNRVYANLGKAVAAYERLLVSADSPFDRFMAGDETAMSEGAVRGAKLFIGKASCNECHNGGNFSDGLFHNVGVPQAGPNLPAVDRGRADGIAAVLADPFNAAGAYSDDPTASGHLDGLVERPEDEGAFKTPTLRGVSRTAPYMHNGMLATLRDVVVHYRDGGGPPGSFAGTLDSAMAPLALDDQEIDDLVAFLEALDGAPLPPALVTAPVLPAGCP